MRGDDPRLFALCTPPWWRVPRMRGDDPIQGMFTKLGGMIAGHLVVLPLSGDSRISQPLSEL